MPPKYSYENARFKLLWRTENRYASFLCSTGHVWTSDQCADLCRRVPQHRAQPHVPPAGRRERGLLQTRHRVACQEAEGETGWARFTHHRHYHQWCTSQQVCHDTTNFGRATTGNWSADFWSAFFMKSFLNSTTFLAKQSPHPLWLILTTIFMTCSVNKRAILMHNRRVSIS